MTKACSLPPSDSPLTTMSLGQCVSGLMQETILYLELSYDALAHEKSLGLPTTYQLRPGERDRMPCWEICFPPVSPGSSKT